MPDPAPDPEASDSLARAATAPLYAQLKQHIQSRIADGTYREGSALPSEARLCVLHSVSRVTVRRAIRDLQDEGVLETRHGKGTFVAVRRVATCLVQLDGVSERFSIGDGVLRVAPLGVTDIAATAETANALRLAPGTAVQEVRRLVLADKRPLALEVIQFERARYSEISSLLHVDRFPAEAANSAQGLGAVIRTISVHPASQAEQTALGCGTAEPVFRVEKVLSDAGGSPLLRFLLLAPCSRTVLCSVSTADAGAQSRYSAPQG